MPQRLPLPKSSAFEDLETISMRHLELLFDSQRFEVRRELQRDKGIDFTVELKHEGCYTNYRFAIQLKSTNSPNRNNDGSISYGIDTRNIGYLRNFPMIAYYVLYDHIEGRFYFEQVWEIYNLLINKYKGQEYPATFNVRFEKALTEDAISKMFDLNLKDGNILRELQPHLRRTASNGGKVLDLIIDSDNKVFSKEDITAYLNHFGYYLINMGAFDYVIELAQRCRPLSNVGPRFYLICSIAYYQKGYQMYEALGMMVKALKGEKEFEPEMAAYLKFITIDTKKRIGLVSKEDYDGELDKLFQKESIGPFFEIERAWRKLNTDGDGFSTKLPVFCTELEGIISSYPRDLRTRAFAYSRIQDIETGLAIYDLTVDIHNSVCVGATHRISSIRRKWGLLENKFHKRMNELQEFTALMMDLQLTPNLVLNRIRMDYSSAFIFAFYENWDPVTRTSSIEISNSDRKRLENHCGFLWQSATEMEKFGHVEIFMPSLILRYQLLHFLGAEEELAETKDAILTALKKYDLEIFEREFEELISNGMEHEHTFWDSTERIIHAYENAKSIKPENEQRNPGQGYHSSDELEFTWAVNEPYRFHFPVPH